MQSHRPRYRLLLTSAWVLALAAGPAFAQNDEASDPFEPLNRKMYAINQAVDHCCLGPAARAYGRYVPKPIRKGIHNFNQNLGEPLVFVNDVLQGHPHAAARTFGRFVINTTWGLVGVIDVAKKGDIPPHDNGFGTTLGKWGAQPGPYLFLPVLGPSTVRDGFGSIVNIFLSPQYYADYPGDNVIGPLTLVADGLNTRWRAQRELDTVQQTSTDPYATLRSYYLQSREARIHGAATTELPDFDTPDATGAPAAPGAPKTTTAPALPDIESEPEPPAAPDAAAPPAPPAPADAAPAPVPEAPAAPPAPPAPDR